MFRFNKKTERLIMRKSLQRKHKNTKRWTVGRKVKQKERDRKQREKVRKLEEIINEVQPITDRNYRRR